MLEDLGLLALEAQKKCKEYDKRDIVLSDAFKKAFKDSMTSYEITFDQYTTIFTSKNDLVIIAPNQWFIIASFFSKFLHELLVYKKWVSQLTLNSEIKNIRGNGQIDTKTEERINQEFNPEDAQKFIRFLTDYDWWSGSKTIDRPDFFVSAVLSSAGVINDSQSYIAQLALHLCNHQNLITILQQDLTIQPKTPSEAESVAVNSPLLKQSQNTIYYGSPGTGKSYKVNEILKNLDTKFYERITFHPEYDHASFMGGYKPITVTVEYENDNQEIYTEDEVKYRFVPQAFTNIYVRAWKDLENQYYLAIEEINRGNCAEIFGDIFQLLDRHSNYTVSPSEELKEYLIKALGINCPVPKCSNHLKVEKIS